MQEATATSSPCSCILGPFLLGLYLSDCEGQAQHTGSELCSDPAPSCLPSQNRLSLPRGHQVNSVLETATLVLIAEPQQAGALVLFLFAHIGRRGHLQGPAQGGINQELFPCSAVNLHLISRLKMCLVFSSGCWISFYLCQPDGTVFLFPLLSLPSINAPCSDPAALLLMHGIGNNS